MSRSTRALRHEGMPLLRYGFRPFFLGAGIWAVLAMAVRVADINGAFGGGIAFGDVTLWHSHALLFGYGSAVVAGFALTAVPNWTGRLPISGLPLLALWGLWLLGRVASFAPSAGPTAAAIDAAFLPILAAMLGREIIAGNNIRNVPVCLCILLLGIANILFHLEALEIVAASGYGTRMGIATLSLLIGIIGGRIVPSFTNNWFARHGLQRRALQHSKIDRTCHGTSLIALTAWIALPFEQVTGITLLVAAVAHAVRWLQWCGWRTLGEPLVLILHIGYAWIPIGFAILGLAILFDVGVFSAGVHALTAGAIGTMTLAVMTRATLGHTGRALHAGRATIALYAAVSVAVGLRIAAVFWSAFTVPLLVAAGIFWITAFAIFVVVYGPMQLAPRVGHA